MTSQEGFNGGRDLRMMNEISGNIRPPVLRFNFMFPGYVLGDGHGEDLGHKLGLTNVHLGRIWTGNG